MKAPYPIFEKWLRVVDWTLDVTEKFPKSVRFSLAGRIASIALDAMEGIIEAIYTGRKLHLLKSVNLHIEKLRILFRISRERRHITPNQYEFISGELNSAGMMVGGWIKSEARRKSLPPGD